MRPGPRKRRQAAPLTRLTRVASLIAFLALGWISVNAVRNVLDAALGNLAGYLQDGMQTALHREVRIAGIDIKPTGEVRLHGIAIAAGKTFASGDLLSVGEARLEYRLQDVLHGRVDPIGGIRTVSLDNASLLIVRNANNRFNLQDLFPPRKKKKPQPSPFRAIVTLHNARIRFVDYAVRDLPAPQANTLSVTSATLDATAPPIMLVQARGRGNSRGVGDVAGEGTIVPQDGTFTFRIKADAGDAAYWQRYFSKLKGLNVIGGGATATVDVWKSGPIAKTAAAIGIDVHDASASTKYTLVPVKHVSGRLLVLTGRPVSTALSLRGDVGGIPIWASGTVFPGKYSRVALKAGVSGMTYGALERAIAGVPRQTAFRPLAPATATVSIYGPPTDLETLGVVQISSAKLYATTVSDLSARFRYRRGVVYIPSITGRSGGAPMTASGTVDMKSKAISFTAGTTVVPLSTVLPSTVVATGKLASHIVITGSTRQWTATAILKTGSGSIRGIPFESVSAKAVVDGKNVRISDGLIVLPGGTVQAQGMATLQGGLALSVRVSGARIGELLSRLGTKDISGTAYFDGTIGGTIARPTVKGHAEVFDILARGQDLDMAAGDVTWRPGQVQLTHVSVARYPAQGELTGTVTTERAGQAVLNIRARLLSGRLEELLAAAKVNVDAQGDIITTDDLRIGGTLASPTVAGRAVITHAMVSGYPIDRAEARFLYSKGLIEATDVDASSGEGAQSEPARLTAKVIRMRGDRLEAPDGFAVTGIRLERLDGLGDPYAKIAGTVDITDGSVNGTRAHPDISAAVAVHNLVVNGLAFDPATARATYNADTISLHDILLGRNSKTILDAREIAWHQKSARLSGAVRTFAVSLDDVRGWLSKSDWYYRPEAGTLRRVLSRFPATAPGTMIAAGGPPANPSGELTFEGKQTDMSVAGTVSITDLTVQGERLTRVAVGGEAKDLRYEDGRLTGGHFEVPERGIEAVSDQMSVDGSVSGTVGGSVLAKLDAKNVPLAFATVVAPALTSGDYTPHGAVTVSVDAEGKFDSPDITASVSGENLTLGSWKVPFALYTGVITMKNAGDYAQIRASSVRLVARGHSIKMSGEVPFSWSTLSVPADAPIAFEAVANEQDLDILKVVFGEEQQGPITAATGTIQASMKVAGTLSKPNWTGSASVKNGSVSLRPLVSVLDKIDADFQLDAPTSSIVVNALSMHSTSGGTLQSVPGGTLRLRTVDGATTLEPDLKVALDYFRLDEVTNGMGFGGERFRGTLSTPANAPITITPGTEGPKLAGIINLSDVELLPPNQIRTAKEGPNTPSIVPAFDLTIVAAKNVRVGNAMYLLKVDERRPVSDRQLRITGNLLDPRVDGRFVSHEGAFTYPTARFRLTDATVAIHYPTVSTPMRVVNDQGAPDEGSPLSVTANAQARLVAQVNGRSEPVTVYLHVEGPSATNAAAASSGTFGTLAPYKLTLRSSPSLPERQLVALISREDALQALAGGTGAPEEVLRQETLNVLQASVLPGALQGVESKIGQAFGLESLSVDYLAMNQAVSITAAKRLGDRVLLTYSRPVGSVATTGDAYTVALSYDLGADLRLTLRQEKGPLLFGTPAAVVPGGEPNLVDTQLLLEGSRPF